MPESSCDENVFLNRHRCRKNFECDTACWYRFDFGVPLEDIYSNEELHPRLKVSFSIHTAFKIHCFFYSICSVKHMSPTNYKTKKSATS